MRTLYNILFSVLFVLSSPYYFYRMRRRGNWQAGFSQRFGKYDAKVKQAITNRHILWAHAVSVGEVNACTQLIRALELRLPNIKIVVSTTTTTGMGELQNKLPSHVSKIYYPIDHRACVSRALSTLHPEAVVLVEAEVWPNFLWRARDLGKPVFLVNARLSEKSYRNYKRFGFLFRPLFASFTGVGAQNEADAARLRELGCRQEAVHVVGNLKFDAAVLDTRNRLDVAGLLNQLGVPSGARIILGGSTWPGEEAILAKIYLRLRTEFPDLFLVLVPRHFERGREVGRELELLKMKFVYRNEPTSRTHFGSDELDCLIVNTTGELQHFYQCATVAFIGKSLTEEGGQNPIEPGASGRAMIFGPNMQNFADVVRSFLAGDGAIQVRNETELESTVRTLLKDENRREQLGRNARKVVQENLGATDRTVEMIINHLESEVLAAVGAGKSGEAQNASPLGK